MRLASRLPLQGVQLCSPLGCTAAPSSVHAAASPPVCRRQLAKALQKAGLAAPGSRSHMREMRQRMKAFIKVRCCWGSHTAAGALLLVTRKCCAACRGSPLSCRSHLPAPAAGSALPAAAGVATAACRLPSSCCRQLPVSVRRRIRAVCRAWWRRRGRSRRLWLGSASGSRICLPGEPSGAGRVGRGWLGTADNHCL